MDETALSAQGITDTQIAPIIAPAQIWFGPDEHVLSEIMRWLQRTVSHTHLNSNCSSCNALRTREHSSVYWVNPEKNYLLEHIEPLFYICSLRREEDDPLFIILQHAELLSTQCANSLLKLVEEPPAGYHFIFLTNKIEAILPTIRSRCHIHTLIALNDMVYASPLLNMLLNADGTPLAFAKELDASKIDEIDSMRMLNELITICTQKTRAALEQNNDSEFQKWCATHSVLLTSMAQPPMSGSSKLFWRNLYLNLRSK